ncbi:MAG: 6-phospho-3-hexuloisomerase [Candidatus Hydrothermarchaeota archaeon]|nr:MAG: 6-phospho-3-hexuloisomerase [Candidatus Hydrothermarchaeota archaeon]
MKVLKDAMLVIAEHVKRVAERLNEEQVERFVEEILKANKVFVYGAVRSGLVGKAFAMRLMHLNINVYVVGEIITPGLKEGDLLILISGSGETTSVVNAAKIAKKAGAKVILITTYPNSTAGKTADHVVVIEGRTKLKGEKDFMLRQIKGEHYSFTPLGTLFEATVMVFLDGVIAELMERLGKSEEDLRERHATIE